MAHLFFVGDSITTGAWDERGGWAARLIGEIMQANIKAQAAGETLWCLPYNLGVSGDAIPNVLARLEHEVTARSEGTPRERREIVIFIGTNDAVWRVREQRRAFTEDEFRSNFIKLLAIAETLAARVSVLGLLPVDDARLDPVPWAPEIACAQRYVKPFEDILAKVCCDKSVRFFPLFERWLALPEWQKLLIDGDHPNSAGHARLAEMVTPFIVNDDFVRFHSA